MTRYFLDTEFVEDGSTIMPISLALLGENGHGLYIEFEFDEEKARKHDFVRENVLPHLRGDTRHTKGYAAFLVKEFLGLNHPASSDKPQIWAYFADYDWVLFCQIFGTMMDLPKNCPKFCMDLQQWWVQLGRPDIKPPKGGRQHDALADAHWNLSFYRNLEAYAITMGLGKQSR